MGLYVQLNSAQGVEQPSSTSSLMCYLLAAWYSTVVVRVAQLLSVYSVVITSVASEYGVRVHDGATWSIAQVDQHAAMPLLYSVRSMEYALNPARVADRSEVSGAESAALSAILGTGLLGMLSPIGASL